MRKLIAVCLGFALGLAGTAGAMQAGGNTNHPPTLRLVKAKPLIVKGARFEVGERVRLRASSGLRARTGSARAGAVGSFVETFDMPYDRCNGLLVTAAGNEGSRARLRIPAPHCPPRL